MKTIEQIYIVGQPGAGKALLGKSLADDIGWQFINADFGLESRCGETLANMLGTGTQAFLDYQLKVLESLGDKNGSVINTDSSIVLSESNRQFLSSKFVVFLDVSLAKQRERMSRNPSPLFIDESFFKSLHAERDEFYNDIATLTINTNDNKLDEHIGKIKQLSNFDSVEITRRMIFDNHELILLNKLDFKPIHLTKKQAVCLKLLSQGKSAKEIADILNLSFRTIESYLEKLMHATDCANSKELIALYLGKYS